jgi:hypothetical protein
VRADAEHAGADGGRDGPAWRRAQGSPSSRMRSTSFIRDVEASAASLLCRCQRIIATASAPAKLTAPDDSGGAPHLVADEQRWSHQQLTLAQRAAFVAAFRAAERRDWVFGFFASSASALKLWPCVIVAELCLLSYARGGGMAAGSQRVNLLLYALACLAGILALQLVFVASHTAAHALFLEYSEQRPGSRRLGNGAVIPAAVYYFAFYHHHASRDDDWAPFLSYNDPKQELIWEHSGTRGIIASHWVGYSHLPYLLPPSFHYRRDEGLPAANPAPEPASWGAWTLTFGVYGLVIISTRFSVPFLFGYELGVLLLPMAHGWQHIARKLHDRTLPKH